MLLSRVLGNRDGLERILFRTLEAEHHNDDRDRALSNL